MNSLVMLAALAFAAVAGPREWTFPRDHGAHPEFRTEWWYYTGHLDTENGRSYGYELVFFRYVPEAPDLPDGFDGWVPAAFHPAHFAITDETGGRFFHDQRIRRDIGGIAGADTTTLFAWCGDWSASLDADGVHHLKASADDWAIDLELEPLKPPVLNGPGGVSRKGPREGQASYYYSLTRMKTGGTITFGDRAQKVTGLSWMDHEFFSSALDENLTGWDWFSIQMDDDTELMLYRLRSRTEGPGAGRGGGAATGASTPEGPGDFLSGTFTSPDGSARPLSRDDITITATATWTSPATGVTYPSAWTLSVSSLGLELTVTPTLADQELDTRATTRVIYWEGSVNVEGRRGGRAVRGRGYVELTGYDGQVPMGAE